jgi:hypothetical protein
MIVWNYYLRLFFFIFLFVLCAEKSMIKNVFILFIHIYIFCKWEFMRLLVSCYAVEEVEIEEKQLEFWIL